MFSKKRKFGNKGEDLACKYLQSKGFSILKRNYQSKFGEIDIIIRKNREIIFVEVKTSKHDSYINPEENFNREKIRKLLKTIEFYLIENKIPENYSYRLDLITVVLNLSEKTAKIKHFKQVL